VAGRLAATGILLVGGASERFGSPKALAPFRGETLAERTWRVLDEAFDEILAVGKEGELELPFPVLDDGSEERAPVFGLIAGLRAASHDVAVALPVDCPLVTPELLRELAEARAVPQTGPLPGAYAKVDLPALEARVARGDLSLRGVNDHVLEVDEMLLANVNTRMELLEAQVADWASEREDVRAAVVIGSQARTEAPADRWSDLDVLLFLADPGPYVDDATWVEEFGRPVVTFLEPSKGRSTERRVLYDTGEDVGFVLLPQEIAGKDGPEGVLQRGYRVLVDKLDVATRLRELASTPTRRSPPTQAEFDQLAADFWYHALWTARKLRRGEVYAALDCLDGHLKGRLVTLLEWHARAVDPSIDTWHDGRFLERWADPGALAALESAYAHYDVRDVARALWATIDLWQGLEEETARRLGLEERVDHADLRRRIDEVVPMTAGGHRIAP
jgi:aminoglycoside 6-adenylyltransferase